MDNKYTKGEWELRGNKIFISGTNNSIATIHIQKSWDEQIRPIEDVEAIANAELIASAPKLKEENERLIELNHELLEALKELYAFNLNGTGYLDIALSQAESAIKRATECNSKKI